MAVGATDPLVRLYDRRMLRLADTEVCDQTQSQCVSYFSPGHLYNRKNKNRPRKQKHYSTTNISFSPNGKELLQYCNGEHIFLYDLDEKRKPLLFESHTDCAAQYGTEQCKEDTTDSNSLNSTFEMRTKHLPKNRFNDRNEHYTDNPQVVALKQKGNDYFSKDNFFQAVTYYNEALSLSPETSVLHANRAAALLRRKWYIYFFKLN